jgi:hypothetical protein
MNFLLRFRLASIAGVPIRRSAFFIIKSTKGISSSHAWHSSEAWHIAHSPEAGHRRWRATHA